MNEKPITYSITAFSAHYNIQSSFFEELYSRGLISIIEEKGDRWVDEEQLILLEHFTRLHQDFNVNPAGIEIIEELLDKVNNLKGKIRFLEERVSFFNEIEK